MNLLEKNEQKIKLDEAKTVLVVATATTSAYRNKSVSISKELFYSKEVELNFGKPEALRRFKSQINSYLKKVINMYNVAAKNGNYSVLKVNITNKTNNLSCLQIAQPPTYLPGLNGIKVENETIECLFEEQIVSDTEGFNKILTEAAKIQFGLFIETLETASNILFTENPEIDFVSFSRGDIKFGKIISEKVDSRTDEPMVYIFWESKSRCPPIAFDIYSSIIVKRGFALFEKSVNQAWYSLKDFKTKQEFIELLANFILICEPQEISFLNFKRFFKNNISFFRKL
jgi:hypothetical protein